MNTTEVQKVLVTLLSSGKASCGRALLITGPWGCGKTYLWKNLVAPQTARPTVYISAFGATDGEDLKSRLLTQFLLRMVNRRPQSSDHTPKEKGSLAQRIASWRPGKAVVSTLNSLGAAALQRVRLDPLELVEFLDERTIICIDDIERISPNYNVGDLLGVVNTLTEHKRFDVVLICNEDRIAAGDPTRAVPYFSYKEKAIFSECHLSANTSEMFERVLESSTRSDAVRLFAISHKDTILSVFRQAEVVNLRLLARVFARIEVLLAAGARLVSLKQMKLLCALTLYSEDKQLPSREFFDFNEFALRVAARMDSHPAAPTPHAEKLAFVDAYFGQDEYDFDGSIYKLVRYGEVDRQAFDKAAAPPPVLSKGESMIKAAVKGEWRAYLDAEARSFAEQLLDIVATDAGLATVEMFQGLAYARFLGDILGMKLDPLCEQAAVDAIRARARAGNSEALSSWTVGLSDALAEAISQELQAYTAEQTHAQRSALAEKVRPLIEKGDYSGLLTMMGGGRIEPLQVVCEDIGLDQVINKRAEFPWFFVVTMQGTLKLLGQYSGTWPQGLEYRKSAIARLDEIANDQAEQSMTRWRAKGLVPRASTG